MSALNHPSLEALQASESRYRRLFEAARDGILLLNAKTAQIEDVNPYLIELLGYSRSEFLGKKLWDVGPFSDMLESKALFVELQEKGYIRYESLPLKTKAGAEIEVEFISNVYDCEGIDVIQCNIRNIAERKWQENQMRHFALYDQLTDLPNRRLLHDRLRQTIAASKRTDCYAALIFFDLDDFKVINDTHGHGVGDLLLIEVARRLQTCVRAVDTVARVGGDEFVIVLGGLNTEKARATALARKTAKKIHTTLSQPYLLRFRHTEKDATMIEYCCTSSMGVTLFINHEGNGDDILGWADAAMYQAKTAGPNMIRFHEADESLSA